VAEGANSEAAVAAMAATEAMEAMEATATDSEALAATREVGSSSSCFKASHAAADTSNRVAAATSSRVVAPEAHVSAP
jgi:hypothetical protein